MPKSMPKSLDELKLPNLWWDYLSAHDRVPFDTHSKQLSLNTAWWLMELSFLVYCGDQELVESKLRMAGFDGALFVTRSSNHVMIVRDAEKLIICFRGTLMNNIDNLITDAKLARTQFDDLGKAHRGFVGALDTIWPDIEKELNKRAEGREIFFTGHSLGGALATLAASRFKGHRQLYSFGSPRIGGRTFRSNYPLIPHFRIVHDHDVITQLPLPVGYRHVGNVCHLRRDGSMTDGTGAWDQFMDNVTDRLPGLIQKISKSGGVWESLVGDNAFADHCPISYATRLWNLVVPETK